MRTAFDRFHHCGPVGRLAPAVDQPNYRLAAWSPATVSSMQVLLVGAGNLNSISFSPSQAVHGFESPSQSSTHAATPVLMSLVPFFAFA